MNSASSSIVQCNGPTILDAPTLSDEAFHKQWSRQEPFVVNNVNLQGDWSPQYFVDRYKGQPVDLVDCENNNVEKSTVDNFFKRFIHPERRNGNMKLKVSNISHDRCLLVSFLFRIQDWPPKDDFKKIFPELFHAFMGGVPCQSLTRLDGTLNLAAHFPINEKCINPDLGIPLWFPQSHAIFFLMDLITKARKCTTLMAR
jgi:hypothetical protein